VQTDTWRTSAAAVRICTALTFSGCAGAKGFVVRYVTRSGIDVTAAVTRDRYAAHVDEHDRARLMVRVSSESSGRALTCDLQGIGMHVTDVVHLRLAS